jgi:hypothetical protein
MIKISYIWLIKVLVNIDYIAVGPLTIFQNFIFGISLYDLVVQLWHSTRLILILGNLFIVSTNLLIEVAVNVVLSLVIFLVSNEFGSDLLQFLLSIFLGVQVIMFRSRSRLTPILLMELQDFITLSECRSYLAVLA